MPLYEYVCKKHGHYEEFMSRDECNLGACPKCGEIGRRKFSAVPFTVDFRPGYDGSLDMHIDTKAQRDRVLGEKGLVRDR